MKNKYFIQFVGCEHDMTTQIQISKKEFKNQIKLLEKQTQQAKLNFEDDTASFSTIMKSETKGCFIKTYCYSIYTSYVYLTHYECKQGYKFK